MAEQAIINVNLPCTGKRFDFKVPIELSVEDGIKLILNATKEEYPLIQVNHKNASMFNTENGTELCRNLTFQQQLVKTGQKFLLL